MTEQAHGPERFGQDEINNPRIGVAAALGAQATSYEVSTTEGRVLDGLLLDPGTLSATLETQNDTSDGEGAPARRVTRIPRVDPEVVKEQDGVEGEHVRLRGSDAYAPGGVGFNGFSQAGRKSLIVKRVQP